MTTPSAEPARGTGSASEPSRGARGYIAVDLGASSGRVMLGVAEGGELSMHEVHRFPTGIGEAHGRTTWDTTALHAASIEGIALAIEECTSRGVQPAGIGIDSWGVDHALLGPEGSVSTVESYRGAADPEPVIRRRRLTEQDVYSRSGIADQPINSALRLGARAGREELEDRTLLFVPDLWVYWLTGQVGSEPTIASTSQLVDVRSGQFSADLAAAVGLTGLRFPPMAPPGTLAGHTTAEVTARLGASSPIPVYRVAGHDTASAFAFATGDEGPREALIASGTWSLVGLCLPHPITSETARLGGFTNELGADGVLFLRNLSGMWVLQECLREWSQEDGAELDLPDLLAEAGALGHDGRVFDVSDDRLLPAGGMPQRVSTLCREVGRTPPTTRAQWVRAVIDSLAAAYVDTICQAADLAGAEVDRIRIVGGGSRNELLCRLTADLSGKPVVAGPVEASSIGNIAIQAVADGLFPTAAQAHRHLRADSASAVVFSPTTNRVWS